VALFGVFRDAAVLYILLWRHSLPAAALAQVALWLSDVAFTEFEDSDLWLVAGIAGLILALAAPMLVQGMLIVLVEDVHEGRRASHVRTLVSRTLPELPSLVGAAIVYWVSVIVGVILFVVPGLLALARWCLMAPLIVLERREIGEARDRSSEVVRGRTGSVLVVVLIVAALEFGLPELAFDRLDSSLAYYVTGVLVTPYVAHVLSALYFRLTDPERPVIAERRPGSPWDEHALEDARRARS
jgi:hypothetical protein